MKLFQKLVCMALTATATASLSICAFAADYTFDTAADTDYYPSTSYEDTYGTAYHFGSKNLVDYQIPELPYGVLSTTQTGVMEKLRLPGLQQTVGGSASGIYGVDSGVGIPAVTPVISSYQEPAYTSAKDMERKDGSIGTLKIPSLDINMKVWEGETKESMKKGLGHYSSTSAWDGNIGVCGHNRGAKYTIGSIKDLEIGDTIEELKVRDEKRDTKLIRYSEAYRGLHYPVHLLSCDETGARQLQIMAVPDYRMKLAKLMLRSAYRPPPEDAPAWDAIYQNRPFVIGADMNLRRIDAAIASAKKRGCLPISLAALDAQGDAVLLRRYKDTGYAVIYKVTESVLTELFGHPPSLYLPPCTQYLTKKGAVVDAPLIQVDRKDRGSPRK